MKTLKLTLRIPLIFRLVGQGESLDEGCAGVDYFLGIKYRVDYQMYILLLVQLLGFFFLLSCRVDCNSAVRDGHVCNVRSQS